MVRIQAGLPDLIRAQLSSHYKRLQITLAVSFKAILLLRKLSFSVKEIKNFLANRNSPQTLFDLKKKSLKQQIADLQNTLADTEKYYNNLQTTGTLVDPLIKTFKPFPVYYIDKLGPYRKIGDYFGELHSYFENVPHGTLGLTIYEGLGYQPTNAKTKICFIKKPGLKPNNSIVRQMTVPGFKALSYTHYGSTKLLSMLWQELKKYRDKKGYQENTSLPFEDLELSHNPHTIEMLMPIK